MEDSYGSWRQTSFSELEKEMRARFERAHAHRARRAALIASIFAPNSCGSYDYNCRRIENRRAQRRHAGWYRRVLSGVKKYADARTHATRSRSSR